MRDLRRFRDLPFNPALRERAKELRRAGILHEVLLWNQLKRRRLNGLDFDRQKVIGNYIVDFFCASQGVVIEVDGASHDEKVDYDLEREAYLTELGLTVIRISAKAVFHHLSDVVEMLAEHPALAASELPDEED